MSEPVLSPARDRRDAGRAGQVALASLLGALVSYVVLWLGARTLSKPDNTVLLTFFSILFAVYGVLSGVATETTRSVATGIRDRRTVGPPVWVAGAAVAVVSVISDAPVLHACEPSC